MTLLEVWVATGASGPVLVLAGDADFTSVTRLDEVLTAPISGQAVQLTIDATNLRSADSASVRTLVVAAMKVRTQDGSVTLLNPQPPVARSWTCCALTRCSPSDAGQCVMPNRTPAQTVADDRLMGGLPSPFGSSKIYFPNGPGLTHGIDCLPTGRNRRSDQSPAPRGALVLVGHVVIGAGGVNRRHDRQGGRRGDVPVGA